MHILPPSAHQHMPRNNKVPFPSEGPDGVTCDQETGYLRHHLHESFFFTQQKLPFLDISCNRLVGLENAHTRHRTSIPRLSGIQSTKKPGWLLVSREVGSYIFPTHWHCQSMVLSLYIQQDVVVPNVFRIQCQNSR